MYNIYSWHQTLRWANDFCCQEARIPNIHEIRVKETYEQGKNMGFLPLVDAAGLGLRQLVLEFISFAKRTYTDPLELQKFITSAYPSDDNTTLHIAALNRDSQVIELLLPMVSVKNLTTHRNTYGKTPLSLLWNLDYDKLILDTMKAAVDPPLQTKNKQPEPEPVYRETVMAQYSYPTSHKNGTRSALCNLDNGKCELTPKRNTILHLVSKFGDVDYTKSILEKHSSLIHWRNSEGETPLYIAAREGNIDILEILINYVQPHEIQEFATRTTDKDTALHVAIVNHHVGVVFWLLKEIPQLANSINCFNESPLYLAVERAYYHIFKLLLDHRGEKAFDGPKGETALHLAVRVGAHPDYIQDLLSANKGLLGIYDDFGWTPFHQAISLNNIAVTQQLLIADRNIIYQPTKVQNGHGSAIHMAVANGRHDLMDYFVSLCPGCLEMTDSNGWNILHVAIKYERIYTFNYILGMYNTITTDLINQRDNNGNTPFHLFVSADLEKNYPTVDYRANLLARNNDNNTPLGLASSEEKRNKYIQAMEEAKKRHEEETNRQREYEAQMEKRKTEEEEERRKEIKEIEERRKQIKEKAKKVLNKVGENLVVVTTLIATATFAAAFTVPGGFDGNEGSSNEGMPILLRKAVYKAFVAANAVAFCCSCCVLFGYVKIQLYNYAYDDLEEEEKEGYVNIISLQYLLTAVAMVAMAVAFVSGTYVILTPSLAFAISVCATCGCIFLLSMFPAKRLGFATGLLYFFRSLMQA